MSYSKIIIAKNCESIDICFPKKIPKGTSILKIEFIGILNDNLVGFYKTKCLDKNGRECTAAVTQFEVFCLLKIFIFF